VRGDHMQARNKALHLRMPVTESSDERSTGGEARPPKRSGANWCTGPPARIERDAMALAQLRQ
jgi:hypothetical protein